MTTYTITVTVESEREDEPLLRLLCGDTLTLVIREGETVEWDIRRGAKRWLGRYRR